MYFSLSILALLLVTCSCIIIRLRLKSGMIERYTIDEESTVATLQLELQQKGLLDSKGMISLRKNNLTDTSRTLRQLDVKAGEIFEIIQPLEEGKVCVQDDRLTINSGTKGINHKNDKSGPSRPSIKVKSKTSSITDIKARKSKLLKIVGQKLKRETSLVISPTIGKIMHGVAGSGGVALVFGSMENNTKSGALTLNVQASYCILLSSAQSFLSSTNSFLPSKLISQLMRLSSNLGLTLLGCVVGAGDEQRAKWSATHVYTALQLRNLSSSPSQFIIISAGLQNSTAVKKYSKSSSPPELDVSLEAFLLSEQAVELYNRGTLRDKYASYESSKRSGKLELFGEVLLQSEEASEVDPLLLAVPVPVLKARDSVDSKQSNGALNAIPIDHLFLTMTELDSIGGKEKSRKYIANVLKKMGEKGWRKSQLYDFNLLLKLQDLLDTHSMRLLCSSLQDKSVPGLPKSLHLALDLVGNSLVDDDDDDDISID